MGEQPGPDEVAEVTRLLAKLREPNVDVVLEWKGGNGHVPFPEYSPFVKELIKALSRSCWMAREYDPARAGRLVQDESYVARARLPELRRLITYIVRGERFCDGHWAAMMEAGVVRRVLERLETLLQP